MDIHKEIENILNDEAVKADNEYGYLIDITTISKINKMGYGLNLTKDGIRYFKI